MMSIIHSSDKVIVTAAVLPIAIHLNFKETVTHFFGLTIRNKALV